jgi:hypothetical protein
MVMGSPQIKVDRPAGAQGALGIEYPYGTQFPVDPELHLRKIFHSTPIANGGEKA